MTQTLSDEAFVFFRSQHPSREFFERLSCEWAHAEWGLRWRGSRLFVNTGGFARNERIVEALQLNQRFWNQWRYTRAKGLYEFSFPRLVIRRTGSSRRVAEAYRA